MQKITIIGRLAKDARIVETQNGTKFISFAIAANSKINNVDKTTWYDVRQFNYNEKMVPYYTKGSSLVVIGELDATIEENNCKNYLRLSVLADFIGFNGNSTSGSTKENTVVESPADQAAPAKPKATKKAAEKAPPEEEISMGNKTKVTEPVEGNDDLPF
jgi:single-stranded DNA-binding protein